MSTSTTSASAGGQPLPAGTRQVLERSYQTNLQSVRVHTDSNAQTVAHNLSTRAVTYGNDIFLGRGERPTDLRVMAHEAAHVVQQRGAPAMQLFSPGNDNAHEAEAEQASAAVLRGESFSVQQQTSPRPQGLFGISLPNPLNWLANQANNIPGFRMFTIILGVNPINMSPVARSAANILRALVEFLPGGGLITQALDNYGIFDRIGAWVEQQIASLAMTGGAIAAAVRAFISSLGLSDLANLGGVWDRARRIFSEPIDRLISFGRSLVTGIIQFIKDAILQPLARLASQTRGWDLLTAVLGQNPITGEAVPRNADTLIGGFMKLIGQEEVWNNLKRANAVARAWSWFQGALSGLLGFVRQIPGLFMQTLRSLELMDIVLLPRAFIKVGSVFGSFLGQFFSWAGQQVMSLLEIIFEVLAPGAMVYIRRAAGAFRTIIQNPIGFIGNLVRAGIQGFRQFATNFLTHLRASLIGWLTGSMSGANIYIPQAFSVLEILKFVLSILGLTWQNIRQKLVRATSEGVVRAMETGFDIVVTLVTQGPAAAWQRIQEGISNLREMVMEQIMTFVRDRVVQAAITRLVTSLNPAGAFIQAVIAIYNTVMFFVERLRQIAQVAMAFIDSISAIASGSIGAAANRVEQTMAGLLTLVISFLARIAGLGRVSDAVTNIVNRIRAPIDRALDRVVDWIVTQARRLGRFVAQAGLPADPAERSRLGMQAAVAAVNRLPGNRIGRIAIVPVLAVIRTRYGFQTLEPFLDGTRWKVRGINSPPVVAATNKEEGTATTAGTAPGGAQAGDVRQAAADLLRARLNDEQDEPAVAAVVSGVLGELRPQGLTRLDYNFVLETGELAFVAAASPPLALFNRFFQRARRRPYAQLAVTMRARDATDLRQGLRDTARPTSTTVSYPSQMARGGQTVTETIGVSTTAFVPGQGAAGSVVVSSPARGDLLQMIAWNTNARNNRDSTGSHAERQFVEWFDRQPAGWRSSVGRVVFQINVSPCTECTQMLCAWRARYPDIRATLRWGRRYPGTTDADIAALGGCFGG